METLQVHCILTIQSIQSICSRILFIRTHISRLRNSRRVRFSKKKRRFRRFEFEIYPNSLSPDTPKCICWLYSCILYTEQSSSHKDDGVFSTKTTFSTYFRVEFEIYPNSLSPDTPECICWLCSCIYCIQNNSQVIRTTAFSRNNAFTTTFTTYFRVVRVRNLIHSPDTRT